MRKKKKAERQFVDAELVALAELLEAVASTLKQVREVVDDFKHDERGECYVAAANLAFALECAGVESYVVHGVVTNSRSGIRMGHAWVEVCLEGIGVVLVLDMATPDKAGMFLRQGYYIAGRVNHTSLDVYSVREARQMILDLEHWGPWRLAREHCDTQRLAEGWEHLQPGDLIESVETFVPLEEMFTEDGQGVPVEPEA